MLNNTIFVTGGTGLLGTYLLRYLTQKGKSPIRALYRSTIPEAVKAALGNRVEWVQGDILDVPFLEDVMDGVQQVYHCAAMVSTNPRDYKEMMIVNKEGTANVVNIALYRAVKKLVHVSSIAAIGRRKNLKHIHEKTAWERSTWNSQYAISKYQSEMEVWRASTEGLTTAIVNPSVILGSGFWERGAGPGFQKIWDGFSYYPQGGTGFVDVRDVARFMVALMNSDISSERFILNNVNLSYQAFFEMIAQVVNKPAPSIKVGNILKEIVWRLEWIRSKFIGEQPLITKESARHTARTFVYDSEKSKQIFDFQYLPIEKTIAEMGNQFLEYANYGRVKYLPWTR